jgi:hypothetical protein
LQENDFWVGRREERDLKNGEEIDANCSLRKCPLRRDKINCHKTIKTRRKVGELVGIPNLLGIEAC